MDIRPELQQFASASEHLLSFDANLNELTEMERDLVQYYLETIREKLSPPSK